MVDVTTLALCNIWTFTKSTMKHTGESDFQSNYTTGLVEKIGGSYQWPEIFIKAAFWILVSSEWKKK